ncbi:MAG TPA: carboxypeptidase-like regulatory domain-containing protein [Armatimonadota bacterium]|nr:carboxypeptidase-like regulatory domain-containing protein [Armatimonadota bacterium]
MRRIATAVVLLLSMGSLRPAFSQAATTPPATSVTAGSGAQIQANQVITQFNEQVSADLAKRGIGPFNTPNAAVPLQGGYQPLKAQLGGPFGDFYGLMQLYLGIDTYGRPAATKAGAASDIPDYPNLELLTTLNYQDHIRGHIEANLLRLPFDTAGKRLIGLPEAYLEYYTDGRVNPTYPVIAGGTYHLSARVGKQGQIQFPYIDPMELFNRISAGYFSYQGLMLLGAIDRPDGALVHASVYRRIGSSGIGPPGFLRDAYIGYQHLDAPSHIFFEARGGWMPRSQDDIPSNGGLGVQGYVGYQKDAYGLGIFGGDIPRQGATFGAGIMLGRSVATELGGLAPSHLLDQPPAVPGDVPNSARGSYGFALEAPIANIYLLTDTHPENPDEPLIGQKNFISTWNTGTEVGVGTTDTVPAGQFGVHYGKDVRRVLTVSPWWMYQVAGLRPPAKSTGNTNGEEFFHYRQDSQYTYYRVLPVNYFKMEVSAVDADTHKPVGGVQLTITSATGSAQQATTSPGGRAHLQFRLPPTAPGTFHIVGNAPNYQPAMQDVTFTPTTMNRATLQMQPLLGTVTGTVVDAATSEGVPDVEVILVPPPPGTPIVKTTGPDGAYQFTDVHPGPYEMRVHKPGYNDVSGPLEVIGGKTVPVNFTVAGQQGGVIVHVVDANGAAVPGASAMVVNATGVTVITRTTGPDGTFAERLTPGTYTINVTATGYQNASLTATVAPGQLQNVTVTLQKQP